MKPDDLIRDKPERVTYAEVTDFVRNSAEEPGRGKKPSVKETLYHLWQNGYRTVADVNEFRPQELTPQCTPERAAFYLNSQGWILVHSSPTMDRWSRHPEDLYVHADNSDLYPIANSETDMRTFRTRNLVGMLRRHTTSIST